MSRECRAIADISKGQRRSFEFEEKTNEIAERFCARDLRRSLFVVFVSKTMKKKRSRKRFTLSGGRWELRNQKKKRRKNRVLFFPERETRIDHCCVFRRRKVLGRKKMSFFLSRSRLRRARGEKKKKKETDGSVVARLTKKINKNSAYFFRRFFFPDPLVPRSDGPIERVDAHGLGLAPAEQLVHYLLDPAHPADHHGDESKRRRRLPRHFDFFFECAGAARREEGKHVVLLHTRCSFEREREGERGSKVREERKGVIEAREQEEEKKVRRQQEREERERARESAREKNRSTSKNLDLDFFFF